MHDYMFNHFNLQTFFLLSIQKRLLASNRVACLFSRLVINHELKNMSLAANYSAYKSEVYYPILRKIFRKGNLASHLSHLSAVLIKCLFLCIFLSLGSSNELGEKGWFCFGFKERDVLKWNRLRIYTAEHLLINKGKANLAKQSLFVIIWLKILYRILHKHIDNCVL